MAGSNAFLNLVCDAAKRRGKRQGGPIGTERARAAIAVLRDQNEIDDRKTTDPKPRPRWFWRDPELAAAAAHEARVAEALNCG